MTPLNTTTVLIVDRSHSWGVDLWSQLASLGVTVHAVSSHAAAIRLATAKKIDVAVIEYAIDRWTKELTAELGALEIPCVYTAGSGVAEPESAGLLRSATRDRPSRSVSARAAQPAVRRHGKRRDPDHQRQSASSAL